MEKIDKIPAYVEVAFAGFEPWDHDIKREIPLVESLEMRVDRMEKWLSEKFPSNTFSKVEQITLQDDVNCDGNIDEHLSSSSDNTVHE